MNESVCHTILVLGLCCSPEVHRVSQLLRPLDFSISLWKSLWDLLCLCQTLDSLVGSWSHCRSTRCLQFLPVLLGPGHQLNASFQNKESTQRNGPNHCELCLVKEESSRHPHCPHGKLEIPHHGGIALGLEGSGPLCTLCSVFRVSIRSVQACREKALIRSLQSKL
jgi:hypothetical protein